MSGDEFGQDYKGLRVPFTRWEFVVQTCQRLSRRLIKEELAGALPPGLDQSFC